MSKLHKVQTLTDASIVTGTLRGLAEGLEHWKEGDVTADMIARLHHSLIEAQSKARRVSEALAAEVEEQP